MAARDLVVATHDTTPVLFWGADLMWQRLDVGRYGSNAQSTPDPACPIIRN
jgi:hypothetical protein